MMDVPSILVVAPSGMVKDEIRRLTPIFSSSVSIFIGIVALEVAVEKAKPITGANFLRKRSGLRRVNSASRIWYTPQHWMNSASRTAPIYLNIGTIAEKPRPANVFAIRQNTPIGARRMTIMVISIMMSLPCWKKFVTSWVLSCSFARMMPMISAKTMTWSISPFASAPIGFFGIILRMVSAKLTDWPPSMPVSTCCTCDISRPMPGLMSRPMPRATATAIMVVRI